VDAERDGTTEKDELDDLKRIEEESRNLELSAVEWDDADEELREFLASGDDEDEEEYEYDEEGDGDDVSSLRGTRRKSGATGGRDRRMGDETGNTGRCAA
jgi:hypothetical protein